MHIGQYSVTNSPLVPAEQEAASRPIVFDESDFDHANTAMYGGETNDVTAIDPAAAVGTVLSPLQIAARAVAAQEEAVLEDAIDADETAACKSTFVSLSHFDRRICPHLLACFFTLRFAPTYLHIHHEWLINRMFVEK